MHAGHGAVPASEPFTGVRALAIHTAAYLATMALVAHAVYRKFGLMLLRRAWAAAAGRESRVPEHRHVGWSRDGSRTTGKWNDIGKFKGPVLRALAARDPYFHDGSAATLEEVVEHYAQGGVVKSNLSPNMKPVKLDAKEKRALVAFMRALTPAQQQVTLPNLPLDGERSRSLPAAHDPSKETQK